MFSMIPVIDQSNFTKKIKPLKHRFFFVFSGFLHISWKVWIESCHVFLNRNTFHRENSEKLLKMTFIKKKISFINFNIRRRLGK